LLFDGERPGKMTAPPTVGENTNEILSELGRNAEQIKSLREAKVI
jgi:crotonobetainyl-CoA:carnitine CoA-transferase CaiB-like acyl-CoA transferase